MSRRAAAVLVACACAFAAACAPPPPPRPVAGTPAPPRPAAFPDDPRPLPRYHSRRLTLSLPLPEGASWRIDDHSRPELVATHAPTRSRVILSVFRTDELVGRTQCEAHARERKLVPAGDLRTLEDDVAITQQTFDTRVWVAVEAGAGPEQPLAGHVMAFGGFLRKCYVFDFSTQVEGAGDEAVLSARLAYARARILGGLELDPFGVVPRQSAVGPDVAPGR